MSFVWVRASLTVWAAPFNEDPLRLLLLFAWLFAVWDGLIAHRKSTLDFCLWTYIVINYTHKFWLLHSPAGFYQCVVEWVAREEMKRRIALKDRLDRLRARSSSTARELRRIRLVSSILTARLFAPFQTRTKLAQEIAELESNLDIHILRLSERSLPSQQAENAYLERLSELTDSLKADGVGFSLDPCDERQSERTAWLMLLESAWTNFVSSAQDTPLQTYSFLAHRIQAGPMTRMPPARLGRRDGWALMLHQLLLNAQELLEEQWQISKVPKRLFGYRLTRWAATIALIGLHRHLFNWPVWETLVFLLFKRTQVTTLNLDSTVEEKGFEFMAIAQGAILSPQFATVDVSVAAVQFLSWRAAAQPMISADSDLDDAILDAVLARNELKQRMRELRDDKREAGSLRRSE